MPNMCASTTCLKDGGDWLVGHDVLDIDAYVVLIVRIHWTFTCRAMMLADDI